MLRLFYSLQQMCVLVEQGVESVCVNGAKLRDEPIEFGSQNVRLESQQLVKGCCNALKIAHAVVEDSTMTTITHRVLHFVVVNSDKTGFVARRTYQENG
jgi:hypothetical protein